MSSRRSTCAIQVREVEVGKYDPVLEQGPLISSNQGSHPACARAAHFEWAMREQREHRTAPFFIGFTHTRQLSAR